MIRHIFRRLPSVKPIPILHLPSLWRSIPLLLVGALSVGIFLNRDRMQDIAAMGYIGAFLVMLLSNATLVLPAPGLVFIFALGGTLNPVLIGVVAAAGATLGELTGYLAGHGGSTVLEDTRVLHRVQYWMQRKGALTIFTLSVIPNPVFDLAGILAGAGRMPVWRFLGTAYCGKVIQSTMIAWAGSMSVDWVQDFLSR